MYTKKERLSACTQLWRAIWIIATSMVFNAEALWFKEKSLDSFWEKSTWLGENNTFLGSFYFLIGIFWLQRRGVKYLDNRFCSERSSSQIGRRNISILLASGSFHLVLMLAASLFLQASLLWSRSIPLSTFFEQKAQLLGIFLTLCVSFWIERTGEKWISGRFRNISTRTNSAVQE